MLNNIIFVIFSAWASLRWRITPLVLPIPFRWTRTWTFIILSLDTALTLIDPLTMLPHMLFPSLVCFILPFRPLRVHHKIGRVNLVTEGPSLMSLKLMRLCLVLHVAFVSLVGIIAIDIICSWHRMMSLACMVLLELVCQGLKLGESSLTMGLLIGFMLLR